MILWTNNDHWNDETKSSNQIVGIPVSFSLSRAVTRDLQDNLSFFRSSTSVLGTRYCWGLQDSAGIGRCSSASNKSKALVSTVNLFWY